MSEWWTYRLSDFLLFAPNTYYRLFELYNDSIWPLQLAGLTLGAVLLVLLVRDRPYTSRVIARILALLWLFVAWAYLLAHYATINWAAAYFAVGFVVEAALLAWMGMTTLRIRLRPGAAGLGGLGLFLFALVLQPLLGLLLGRPWTGLELFGVAPDPTVAATLGLLVLAEGRGRAFLWPLPLLWCAVSGLTLWTMESSDAAVMPLAGLVALAASALPSRRPATQS